MDIRDIYITTINFKSETNRFDDKVRDVLEAKTNEFIK